MSLAAGALRHRITLQRNAAVQDQATGELVDLWADVATVWAQIVPLSGREFIAAQATQAGVTARIVIRARDVDASMRVAHGADLYNIHAVLPDPISGREYITLMAEKLDSTPLTAPSALDGGNAASAGPGAISGGNAVAIDGGAHEDPAAP